MSSHVVSGKRVLVLGLGVTGRAVVAQLEALPEDQRPERVSSLDATNPAATFKDQFDIELEQYNLVVASPGWKPSTPILVKAQDLGLHIWSEIELAWQLRVARTDGSFAPWVGVTGTNGKTTTVGMLESILNADGRNAVAVGNVGRPVIEVALDPTVDAIALELSSFQLHFTHTLALDAGAVLNIAPDHIDWHGTYEEYARAKGKIFNNVKVACIYNVADSQTRGLVERADVSEGARAVGFTLGSPGRGEFGLVEDVLVDRAFHMDSTHPRRHESAAEVATLADLDHLKSGDHLAPHIVANALAASALARAVGVSQAAVRDGLRNFSGGGHRIANVASLRVDGGSIDFVDDSKATNAHAAQASLMSFPDKSVVWIAGGLAKGATFETLVNQTAHKLSAVVVIGVDQEPMREALGACTDLTVEYVEPLDTHGEVRPGQEVMAEAVARAGALSRAGNVVLMAPACASMDQFSTYAERGDAFTEAALDYARQNAGETNG